MKASDSERFPTERRITRALELRTMLNTAILSHPFGDPVWRGNKVKKKSFSLWKIFKIYKCRKVLDAETEFSHDLSGIILQCWFGAQETFLIISVEKCCVP